jgi:deoxyadenosine/deoxycytidine kinase
MKKLICCVDGNIGAGKSSVLDELGRRGYPIFKEELDNWGWCLDKFYVDPYRWAFTLQMAIFQSMTRQYRSMLKHSENVILVERSPASGMLFSVNSHRHGLMNDDELKLIENFHEMFGWTPFATFKLNTDVDTCFERIKFRGRECEKRIDINYLKWLDSDYSKQTSMIPIETKNLTIVEISDQIERKIKRFIDYNNQN